MIILYHILKNILLKILNQRKKDFNPTLDILFICIYGILIVNRVSLKKKYILVLVHSYFLLRSTYHLSLSFLSSDDIIFSENYDILLLQSHFDTNVCVRVNRNFTHCIKLLLTMHLIPHLMLYVY